MDEPNLWQYVIPGYAHPVIGIPLVIKQSHPRGVCIIKISTEKNVLKANHDMIRILPLK